MKVKVYLHAIARFNETTSIITGGLEDSLSVHQINKTSTNEPTRNTWYFSHVSEEFQRGLDLANRRYGHASSTIQDRKTKENIVAVVGGNVNDAETDTTELLVYEESIWKWKAGKNHVK